MRVSFDLDEVLFVNPKKYEIEKPLRGLAVISVLMLINDAVELVLTIQKRQRKLNREAIKRLRSSRKRLQPGTGR